jgi:hypothetical protein
MILSDHAEARGTEPLAKRAYGIGRIHVALPLQDWDDMIDELGDVA